MATLLFFGKLADIAGAEHVFDVQDHDLTLEALCARLSAQSEAFAAALRERGVRIAVDQVFAHGATAIKPSSEIAFMPPMSGG